VVEALFLPKATLAAELFVEFRGGEALPRMALVFDFGRAAETNKQVNVIGHDDKVAQVITVAVEVTPPDGSLLAGAEHGAFDWDIGAITAVEFSADGKLCAAAGENGRVAIWDVKG
jgi:WD40 repeat protein